MNQTARDAEREHTVSGLVWAFNVVWRGMPGSVAVWGEARTAARQRATEEKVRQLLRTVREGEVNPGVDALERMQRLKSSLRGVIAGSSAPEHQPLVDAMLGQFSDAGDSFVREARREDRSLTAVEIFQGLRNLWILNSLQAAFGIPVCLTRPAMAYSLLYPYTDNYLDSTKNSPAIKRAFIRSVGLRLEGCAVRPASPVDEKVYGCIAMIEREYPRAAHPDLHASLRAIHRAQDESLRQQRVADLAVITDISIRKGGTSVLADAYLAKGWLTPGERRFAFGYGVLVQLIDDLQDVEHDLRKGHHTLFTLAANEGKLDGVTNRLCGFLRFFAGSPDIPGPAGSSGLVDLVERSCRGLILEAVAVNAPLFSRSFVAVAEAHAPMRFAFVRDLHEEERDVQTRLLKGFHRSRFVSAVVS